MSDQDKQVRFMLLARASWEEILPGHPAWIPYQLALMEIRRELLVVDCE